MKPISIKLHEHLHFSTNTAQRPERYAQAGRVLGGCAVELWESQIWDLASVTSSSYVYVVSQTPMDGATGLGMQMLKIPNLIASVSLLLKHG
jgi:hypothetical protein